MAKMAQTGGRPDRWTVQAVMLATAPTLAQSGGQTGGQKPSAMEAQKSGHRPRSYIKWLRGKEHAKIRSHREH